MFENNIARSIEVCIKLKTALFTFERGLALPVASCDMAALAASLRCVAGVHISNIAALCGDFQAAARVLEDMALKEGSCPRWRQLMVRFVAEGGEPPDHLHNMMMLDNNDEHLKEYVEARKIPKMETMTPQGDQK